MTVSLSEETMQIKFAKFETQFSCQVLFGDVTILMNDP